MKDNTLKAIVYIGLTILGSVACIVAKSPFPALGAGIIMLLCSAIMFD